MKPWLKYLLFPISVFYRSIVIIKNFLYDSNILKTAKLPCHVVSIGNLNLGGTGKTPTVLYLSKLFQDNKISNVAILSRGYKRNTSGTILVSKGNGPLEDWQNVGDEPFMMAKKTKNIPIVVDNNRFRGGSFLIKKFKTKIIILDDGFQHRSLSRDLDLVLINGKSKLSDYSFFSTSYLRETWSSLKRADAVIFTKNNPKIELINSVKKENIFYLQSKIKSLIVFPKNSVQKITKNKRVFLLSGIGDPKSFEKTAREHECIIVGEKNFRDHYCYTKKKLTETVNFAKKLKADYILTTEKDWAKIRPLDPNFSFAILVIELNITNKRVIKDVLKKHLRLDLSHSPSKNDTNKS